MLERKRILEKQRDEIDAKNSFIEELSDKTNEHFNIVSENMQTMIDEATCVKDVAQNTEQILDDIDKTFSELTGLDKIDISFLSIATALQCCRIFLLNEFFKERKAGKNELEEKLHKLYEKVFGKMEYDEDEKQRLYYAPLKQIITTTGVPYDAQGFLTEEAKDKILKKDFDWDFDISEQTSANDGVFKGGNHRFATTGHDPLLGLIFGTSNIMTNTISFSKKDFVVDDVNIPLISTRHVIYTSDFKHPRIGSKADTMFMLCAVAKRSCETPKTLVASLVKYLIHLGTDLFTTAGIPLPGANLILSTNNVEKLTRIIGTGDVVQMSVSALLTQLINFIISALHALLYDEEKYENEDVYSVKTRKIIMYSNSIAESINIAYVGVNAAVGNGTAMKQLDVGGILVTAKRLLTDIEYIYDVKQKFISEHYLQLVRGEPIELKSFD